MKEYSEQQIKELVTSSCFNKSNYEVNISIYYLFQSISDKIMATGLQMFMGEKVISDNKFINIAAATPPFQRNNDKWSAKMQQSFIDNTVMGMKTTPIFLYEISEQRIAAKVDCYILDGLQRLTCLLAFVKGEILFKGYSYSEMREKNLIRMVNPLVRVYQFSTEVEAVKFYISMNENITHSKKDIKRAYNYLAKISKDVSCETIKEKI